MPYLDRASDRLHYQLSGRQDEDAPVLVFSHSLGSDLGAWEPQCLDLEGTFRILRYDHPGHGKSSMASPNPDPGPDPLRPFGEVVLDLLNHLGIERAHFCGLSLGGMVGQWLAIRAADRIDRLVLCSTTARIEDSTLLRNRLRQLTDPPASDLTPIADHVLAGWFSPNYRAAEAPALEPHRARLLRVAPDAYAATAKAVCAADLRSELGTIRALSLVIWGTDDLATPPVWNAALAETIPGARGLALPGAHLINVEAATLFSAALGEFLQEPAP